MVYPDLIGTKDPNNAFQTGSHVNRVDDKLGPEVTIGMDMLKNLHLYVASQEHKLYITYSPPTAAAAH